MRKTLAMLLAGGKGSRLNILASHRAKPAVPFAGIYRIIDITLSNIMNSNIYNVGILTQYRASSLIDHIQTGESWGFYGKNRSAIILPPYTGAEDSSWYAGTADAVFQNINYVNRFDEVDRVLILSGDHIYKMNYERLIDTHRRKKADVTLVAMEVPIQQATRFGTIIVDEDDKVIDFEEKPKKPKSNLVSLGIYIFDKDVLLEQLEKDAGRKKSSHDFGKDVLPSMLKKNLYIHRFKGYWRDVGTIDSYWETSMDILNQNHELASDFTNWRMTTNFNRLIVADRNAAYIDKSAKIKNSLISEGCTIEGKVENSILSPGVVVEKGAFIKDSIIFHDTSVKKDALVNNCIVDKNVVIGEKVILGQGNMPGKKNKAYPTHLYTGITIVGKGTSIPNNIEVGRNCILDASLKYEDFNKKNYSDGEIIKRTDFKF
ncbi:glucose-1-phosphate adenylyltransferase family protein [bacterium]